MTLDGIAPNASRIPVTSSFDRANMFLRMTHIQSGEYPYLTVDCDSPTRSRPSDRRARTRQRFRGMWLHGREERTMRRTKRRVSDSTRKRNWGCGLGRLCPLWCRLHHGSASDPQQPPHTREAAGVARLQAYLSRLDALPEGIKRSSHLLTVYRP